MGQNVRRQRAFPSTSPARSDSFFATVAQRWIQRRCNPHIQLHHDLSVVSVPAPTGVHIDQTLCTPVRSRLRCRISYSLMAPPIASTSERLPMHPGRIAGPPFVKRLIDFGRRIGRAWAVIAIRNAPSGVGRSEKTAHRIFQSPGCDLIPLRKW